MHTTTTGEDHTITYIGTWTWIKKCSAHLELSQKNTRRKTEISRMNEKREEEEEKNQSDNE